MVGVSYLVPHSKTERLQEALGGGGPVRASREGQEGTNGIEQACQTDWVVPRLVLWFTVMAQLLFGCSPSSMAPGQMPLADSVVSPSGKPRDRKGTSISISSGTHPSERLCHMKTHECVHALG